MSKKVFLGELLHGFTLEHNGNTCLKFGHPTQETLMELRGTLHAAISEQHQLPNGAGSTDRKTTYSGSTRRPLFSIGPTD
jgi:hypothetical protein